MFHVRFLCPRCGLHHSVEEYEKSRFCTKCGTYLSFQCKVEGRAGGLNSLFPYEPYPQQVQFMKDIAEVLGGGGVLIAEACNGFGKTISALSSILALGKDIVYATRTHEQARQVLQEVNAINRKGGASFSAVSLAGRRHLCMNKVCRSLPPVESSEACKLMRETGKCPFKSEVTSLPSSLPSILSIKELQSQGRILGICPYFLARKVAETSTVTVAPYQYIFNEAIRVKAKLTLSGKALIFDEAHNADKVGLDALSDTISERGLSNAHRELQLLEVSPEIIERLKGYLSDNVLEEARVKTGLKLREELKELLQVEDISSLADSLSGLADEVRKRKLEEGKVPASNLGGVASFLFLVASSPSDRYIAVYRRSAQGLRLIEYRCLDPSLAIKPVVREASGALIMSGTLPPLTLFAEVIGLPEAKTRAYSSIARRENVRLIIDVGVTTRFAERSVEMAILYGRRIAEASERIPNGILVFFTQRALMLKTLAIWQENGIVVRSGKRILLGKRPVFVEGRDAEQNQAIVEEYKRAARSSEGAMLLSTFRGRNAEGSNFPDEEARGIFLVGVPYADYCDPIVKAQVDYFNLRQAGLGQRWYIMDAFRAANQAIGRGIRHRNDWCTFILMDRRYMSHINLIAEWARANGVEVAEQL